MRTRITRLGIAAAALLVLTVALPVMANAEYFVPPGNSAATQYTEAYPTAGGHRNAEKGQGEFGRSPSQALGKEKASRLEDQGQAGQDAADFAAETAPAGATGGGGKTGGGPQTGPGQRGHAEQTDDAASRSQSGVEGSSGIEEVLGQATGSSSGEMGLLLPLIIIGAIAWGFAFLRWRKSPTA